MCFKACAFFGHRDCSFDVYENICQIIEELIINNSVKMFYVGYNGNYDLMVSSALKEIYDKFKEIQFYYVLSGLNYAKKFIDNENTILPNGIELVPKRFAISWRNKWMVNNSDYVVCYITRNFGGAEQFVRYAKYKNKNVINIAEKLPEPKR